VSSPGENPPPATEQLIDLARRRGFTFVPAGEGGSQWGERNGPGWLDVVFINAYGPSNSVRSRRGHTAPGEPLFTDKISGTALTALHTVTSWPDT
jgi:hypothetical protein